MKSLLTSLLTIFLHLVASANMASPIWEGTLGSRPFISEYVDVTHEELEIKIDEDFEQASFNVKYYINASVDGFQIPFLFYASEFLDSFSVKVDGQSVEVTGKNGYDFNVPQHATFEDFSYFFDNSSGHKHSILLEDSPNGGGFYVDLHDMIYFETDIKEGKHLIEVSYRATKWTDTEDWIKEYSFRYALSPAKYWRSFGTLNVKIDGSVCKKNLNTNLGEPNSGSIGSIAHWKFDALPTEILQISYQPEVSTGATILTKINAGGLAFMICLVLAIIHLFILINYRKRNPVKKRSIVVIIGSIFIPLIFIITWVYAYYFIDFIIGEHAGRYHGYTIFLIVFYPIILPFYWIIFWIIDKRLKAKYNQSK